MSELKQDLLRLGGTLLAITVAVALCLGVVDTVTRDTIADRKKQDIDNAMRAVCGEDASFEPLDAPAGDTVITSANQILRGGQPDGVCVQVAPSGYGGEITMIVGVDSQGQVLGVQIVDMSETAGLGSNASKPEWLAQFEGAAGQLSVVKTPTGAPGEITALSGATITSKAVTEGVQAAIDYAATQQ